MYTWKFDNVDLADYGVKIRSSRGILDFPRLRNDGHEWLDQHGKDYWQSVGDLKYHDREIVLDCYISAHEGEETTAYEEFLDKLDTFLTAISGDGQHSIETPYGIILDVTVQNGVTVEPKYQYVKSLQVGLFQLRLSVAGDDPRQLFSIIASGGTPVVAIIGTTNMQVNRTLQGESYASCTAETATPISVSMYDYILINTNGVNDEPYYLYQKPELKKVSSNKYIYDLKLEHGSTLLRNSQFLLNGESDFYLYANLETIVDLVVSNSQRFIVDKFRKGTIATTVARNHKFNGENCYDVIRRIAAEYELEYDIRFGVEGPRYTISIQKQIATEKAITLEYGKGNELYELNRLPINRDDLVTKLYAYGAAKNLPPDYRTGKKRLEFTGNPLIVNENLYMGIEKVVFWDDIFPQRSAYVQNYYQKLLEDLTDAEKEIYPHGIYRVQDLTIDFDLNDYLLGGLTAKIRMKSGDLAGYEFDIWRYDHDNRYIFIIPFKDERGEMFPNETLMISGGDNADEYTLIDIDQPAEYIPIAEAELQEVAEEYMELHSVPQYPYRSVVKPSFTRTLLSKFEVGDRITVSDTDMGINQLYRIRSFVYNCYKETFDLTLSEYKLLTKRERLELRLNDVERGLKETQKNLPENTRRDHETTGELRNRTFDPADDHLAADRIVRNESIDPRMLAYDAGVPQFSIKGLLVETYYNGDENAVYVGTGSVIISNWAANTKKRYHISQDRSNYDPTRTWTVAEKYFTLETEKGYFLYVKLPVDEQVTAGELEIQEEHVEAKRYIEDGYIYYKLGYINIAQSPRTASMLWGNTKAAEVDPRMISGGTVIYLHTEDSDINTYEKALKVNPEDELGTYQATAKSDSGDVLIKCFITDPGFPGVTLIEAGAWVFTHWMAVTANDRCSLVVKVYKRDTSGTETELFNFVQPIFSVGTAQYFKAVAQSQIELDATDRLVFKYYHRTASLNNRIMYLDVEGIATSEYRWSNIRIPVATQINDLVPFKKTGWQDRAWEIVTLSHSGRQITLTPVGSSFNYWIQGTEYVKTAAESITIDDTTGLWFVYYNGSTLEASLTPWVILDDDKAFITAFYWNAAQQLAIVRGCELHTYGMGPSEHNLIHTTIGTRYVSGLAVSINGTNAWKIDVTEGQILDEDIPVGINDTPAAIFGQVLAALEAPKLYRYGAGEWRQENAVPSNIVSLNGSNEVYINKVVTGNWALVPTVNNKFSAMWLIAFNDWDEPLKWVIGQEDGDTLAAAINGNSIENMNFSGLPGPEKRILARVIVKNITNSPYYEIIQIDSMQNDDIIPGKDVTTDSYVTGFEFDENTRILTVHRNNGLPDLTVEIPGGGDFVEDVFVETDPQFPIDYLKYTIGGVDYDITTIPHPNGLVGGGIVTWISELTFQISAAAYYIDGILYMSPSSEITLDAADPDDPRIDIIVVDTNELVAVVKGTPAENPLKPAADPLTQIELTQVLIPAGATEPGVTITDEVVYNENTEWTGASSGVTVNFASGADHFRGSVCAAVGSIGNNDAITFTTDDPLNIEAFEALTQNIKLLGAIDAKKNRLFVEFLLSGVPVSQKKELVWNGADVTNWQNLALSLSTVAFTGNTFDAIRYTFIRTLGGDFSAGFYLDYVKLETGVIQITQPIVDEKVKLDATDPAAGYLTPKLAGVDADTVADGDTFNFVKVATTVLKKITWTNIKATLKTYFDGVYSAIGHVHTFLSLSDTPATYTDQAGKAVIVNENEDGLEFGEVGGGVDTFLELTDTPAAYTGQGGKVVKVKSDVSGLEFGDAGGGAMSIIDHSTGAFTLALTDASNYLTCNYASGFNVTVPKNSVVAFPIGTVICLEQTGNGAITMAPVDGDVTLVAYDGLTSYGQYAVLTLVKKATDVWNVIAGTGF